ncbi:MAG: penicillin amidase [Sphingomonadales bacterium BRH_c42]|nr:MAG: penicillin amidase [Sphingomonadales bacterium BRH_c42]
MRKWTARAGWAALSATIAIIVALASWEPFYAEQGSAPVERQYRAEIVRDAYGVPHIYGATDADTAFGVAIAHAEDDFSTLQDVVAMSRGRYGAIAGEEGAAVDYAYHLLDARGTAERHYPELPEDTRALFDAYASGLNQYAREHPAEVKLANLFPVGGVDVAAGFALRQPFFFGLGNVIQPLVEGTPMLPEFGPPTPATNGKSAHAWPLPWGEDGALSGSNAFAIAPKRSDDGVTRLVSNSHQPWRGGVAWYELTVESGEGWHFTGANFPGSPFPFLGHNEDLGWTNTVNRPDMIDVYRLEMDESGTRYRLDGKWRDLESRTVTLPVRIGPVVLPVRRTVYRSVHGPVIVNTEGAFAIRYGGIDNIDQLDAYYRLNKAKNLGEWQAQLARMAIPSTNFVYADKAGNIAYVYNAAIPDRPRGYDWRGVLPGDDGRAIWKGPVAFAALPKLINPASGWLYNSNNEPFTAAGAGSDIPRSSVAPEMGVELKQTNRSRRAWKLLSAAPVIGRAALEAIKYDTAYERAGYVADLWDALERLDLPAGSDLAKARALLVDWDFTADGKGRSDALALLMIKDFMSAEYQNKPLPDVREKLEWAVEHLKQHFGRIDPPMADLLRLRQGQGASRVDLPLDGGSDTLRASTTWDVEEDGRLSVKHGDSYILFVEWEPGKPVRSQSIQPFGAATTRPQNPHHTDQARLFATKKLKPVHFWREDVLANARRRYVVESN